VRNAAGISFDRNGNLIFQDNGFSDPPNTEFTLSSDELNRISANELGSTVPDFGFSESYVRISDGVIVNPSPGYRAPLVSFLPLNGRKSEGAVEVSIAPSGFPSEFIDTVFTTFFGKFGVGTARNDENPLVAANPETGAYYHFINSAQMGNPSALLAAGDSLYVGDYSKTGLFFGPGADTAGAIYRITPVQAPSFRNLPLLQQAGSSSASLAWSIDADAISSLELWGGSILAQAPRLYTLAPQTSGTEFVTSAVLQDLQPGTTYFYRVRLGDQVCEASFTTSTGVTPTISLAIAEPSVTEDGQANLRYLFSRSGEISSALTVNYTVSGTATLGTDYTGIAATPATKTVTIAAGSATAIVAVDPNADVEIEHDETVALTLATGTGYTVGTTAAVVGTILNDDVSQAVNNKNPIALRNSAINVSNNSPDIRGQLAALDQEGDPIRYSLINDKVPGLTLQASGEWQFNPRDPAYLSLSGMRLLQFPFCLRLTIRLNHHNLKSQVISSKLELELAHLPPFRMPSMPQPAGQQYGLRLAFTLRI
jgi:hypothetical protein